MVTELWFDVGIKRYTTRHILEPDGNCCGLMQESKDIQQRSDELKKSRSCGLMQESKDIQRSSPALAVKRCCGLMQESKDIQLI